MVSAKGTDMPNKLAHFAIAADDVSRARAFYEAVFDWTFEPWGPPDFYLIHGAGVHGALQRRPEPQPDGKHGFECSIAVDDVDRTAQSITAAGGQILGAKVKIPTVGELFQFADTEGNRAVIIQYESARKEEMGLS